MRIAIDGRSLLGVRTGIGTYTYQLVRRFPSISPDQQYIVFLNRQPSSGELEALPEETSITYRTPRLERLKWWFGWAQLYLPLAAHRAGSEVIFSPGTGGPYLPLQPLVVTVHDLSPLHFPQYFTARARRYWNWIVPANARRAQVVLTISEYTKMDLCERLNIASDKVVVTHLAADPQFRPQSPERVLEVCLRLGLKPGFLLYVGTIEPRKNLPVLFRAIRLLLDRGVKLPPLVLAGWRGWLWEESVQAIRDLALTDHIRLLDYVPSEDLPALYTAASLFTYVSVFEGFGLPPLEAMACGTPVVTSNCSSLPEVVGDAALLVDPNSPEEIAHAIDRGLHDTGLRLEMRERGLARAARYSWDATARQTLAVLRSVAHHKD
ncbi:MAG: glycosyltransferase family 4 protein [Bacillota bacterium]